MPSTPWSRSLHLRQQLCPQASLLERLEPPLEVVHGSALSPSGVGKILAGEQQVLALAQSISASEAPKAEPSAQLDHDDICP
jgi:hypothetical protein